MTRKTKPPVSIYSALADTTRCRIIEILAEGAIPVHRLADAFSISRPAISRHLRVLKQAGLVAEVKKGRENVYAFRAQKLGKAVDWIAAFSVAGNVRPSHSVSAAVGEEAVTSAVTEVPAAAAAEVPSTVFGAKPKARASRKVLPDPAAADPASQMGFDF